MQGIYCGDTSRKQQLGNGESEIKKYEITGAGVGKHSGQVMFSEVGDSPSRDHVESTYERSLKKGRGIYSTFHWVRFAPGDINSPTILCCPKQESFRVFRKILEAEE